MVESGCRALLDLRITIADSIAGTNVTQTVDFEVR
jgi:hypothetical protein